MTELLLALSLINQNPTVTIPIDPAKLLAQVAINTTFVDAQGVKWELKGTLIARPIAPAPVPTPTPPSSTTPQINAFRDLQGEWLTAAKAGQRFLVMGENFGDNGGLEYAFSPITAIEWSDELIVGEMPAVQRPSPASAVTVKRDDGAYYTGLAFKVVR
jgi:hypothetical protein